MGACPDGPHRAGLPPAHGRAGRPAPRPGSRRAPGNGYALIFRMRMYQLHAAASPSMALALVAGCSEVNQSLGNDDSIDYQSTRRSETLSIPPDLTQASAA